jgi:hypothetical protein
MDNTFIPPEYQQTNEPQPPVQHINTETTTSSSISWLPTPSPIALFIGFTFLIFVAIVSYLWYTKRHNATSVSKNNNSNQTEHDQLKKSVSKEELKNVLHKKPAPAPTSTPAPAPTSTPVTPSVPAPVTPPVVVKKELSPDVYDAKLRLLKDLIVLKELSTESLLKLEPAAASILLNAKTSYDMMFSNKMYFPSTSEIYSMIYSKENLLKDKQQKVSFNLDNTSDEPDADNTTV